MKNLLKKPWLLLILISLLNTAAVKASHLIGGHICYEYIGYDSASTQWQYAITYTLYADPAGVPPGSSRTIRIYLDNGPPHTQVGTASLPRIIQDKVPAHPYVCIEDSNITIYDVDRHVYYDTIGVSNGTSGHHVVTQSCCRSGVIINLTGGGTTEYAYIPSALLENTSPCFTDEGPFTICDSFTVSFSNAVGEPDGDSLVWSFVNPWDFNPASPPFNNSSYAPNHSVSQPFGPGSSAVMDSATGVATVYSSTGGIFVLAVELREYRAGILIGILRKEFQIFVQNCTINLNGCVWPGDANYDGTVNAADLLPIGIGFGSTGPERIAADLLDWYAQDAADWGSTFINGVNYKHADCNGDSTINNNDTIAIMVNYGRVHSKSASQSLALPGGLFLEFPADTIEVGDTLEVPIKLGEAGEQINVYGMAFTITYGVLVDSGSASVNMSNGWLGNSSNSIYLYNDFPDLMEIDVAVVRTDQNNKTGDGQIGTLKIIIEDNLDGKTGPIFDVLKLGIKDAIFIDSVGNLLIFPVLGDSVVVRQSDVGVSALFGSQFLKIYPNPAKQSIQIVHSGGLNFRLTDLLGRSLANDYLSVGVVELDVSKLPAGIYFLKVDFKEGSLSKKLIINR